MLTLKAKRNARRFAAIIFIVVFGIVWLMFFLRSAGFEKKNSQPSISDYKSMMTYTKPGDILDRKGNILLSGTDGGWEWQPDADTKNFSTLIGPDIKTSAVSKYTMLGAASRQLLGIGSRKIYNPLNMFNPTPASGSDVRLTVDSGLQKKAAELLKDHPTSSIFMYNYKTGDVYTSMSKPTFNPITLEGLAMDKNDKYMSFSEPDGAGINKNIAYLRPPGSTMKTVTAAIALDYKNSLKDFSCECTGKTTINGVVIKCHSTHGTVKSMAKALDKSCNIYFATLASKIPDDVFNASLKDFYFNDVVAYGEYNVADGIFGAADENGDISTTDKLLGAFGQATCRTTPLQMASIYGYIASKGDSVLPCFFAADGRQNEIIKADSMCSSRTCKTLCKMLESSVEDGSGSKAYIKNMHVIGKSGTAQWGDGRADTAWFVAAIQNKDYPVVAVVCLDETSSGGASAAPIARKMLEGAIELIDSEE